MPTIPKAFLPAHGMKFPKSIFPGVFFSVAMIIVFASHRAQLFFPPCKIQRFPPLEIGSSFCVQHSSFFLLAYLIPDAFYSSSSTLSLNTKAMHHNCTAIFFFMFCDVSPPTIHSFSPTICNSNINSDVPLSQYIRLTCKALFVAGNGINGTNLTTTEHRPDLWDCGPSVTVPRWDHCSTTNRCMHLHALHTFLHYTFACMHFRIFPPWHDVLFFRLWEIILLLREFWTIFHTVFA